MQVDFYQLSRDPAEAAVAMIAAKVVEGGGRLLVVAGDAALRERIGAALWGRADSFLAHGEAGAPHAARQPILVGDGAAAARPENAARFIALADGGWCDAALDYDRAFLMFDAAGIEAARATWRMLDGREGVQRNYWRQEQGRWIKAA